MILTNLVSRIFGAFASYPFPKPIQKFINRSYVKIFDIDMSEFRSPDEYESLNQLFTRSLQHPRRVPSSKQKFISPVDGTITQVGKVYRGLALQIKGIDYSIQKLLGDKIDKTALGRLENGDYINFYLSPRDYHHYHMPYDAKIKRLFYFPGKLYPVNMQYLQSKLNLFVENERVVIECETENRKLFYIVLIGALNVGKMVVNFDSRIETNTSAGANQSHIYQNLRIQKGEDLGYFKMGSTVVVIAERGLLRPVIQPFEKVKFGAVVAEVKI